MVSGLTVDSVRYNKFAEPNVFSEKRRMAAKYDFPEVTLFGRSGLIPARDATNSSVSKEGLHLDRNSRCELGMSAAELVRKMNVPTNRVTQILNGTRAITANTALRLAHFFGRVRSFG